MGGEARTPALVRPSSRPHGVSSSELNTQVPSSGKRSALLVRKEKVFPAMGFGKISRGWMWKKKTAEELTPEHLGDKTERSPKAEDDEKVGGSKNQEHGEDGASRRKVMISLVECVTSSAWLRYEKM